jgi:hypothetical protein
MFNWASDISVYMIPEDVFQANGIPPSILYSEIKNKPIDFLVEKVKNNSLDVFKVRGELCFENGCLVMLPKQQSFIQKITPSSNAMKGVGSVLGLAGVPGLIGGAVLVGAAYVAEKTIKSLTPDEDKNPNSLKNIFGAESKFPETQAKYKVSEDNLIYVDSSDMTVFLTDRGGRSGMKKFFDFDETADQGINLFVGNLIYKNTIRRGIAFFISIAKNEDTIKTLKKEGFLESQFKIINRIEKKSWSLY